MHELKKLDVCGQPTTLCVKNIKYIKFKWIISLLNFKSL